MLFYDYNTPIPVTCLFALILLNPSPFVPVTIFDKLRLIRIIWVCNYLVYEAAQ